MRWWWGIRYFFSLSLSANGSGGRRTGGWVSAKELGGGKQYLIVFSSARWVGAIGWAEKPQTGRVGDMV